MTAAFAIIQGILAFFNTTIGKYVGYGLIAVAVFFAGDLRGRRIEHEKCEAAARAAVVAAQEQDANAKKQVEDNAKGAIADLSKQKDDANAQLAALQKELVARPINAPCLYGVGEHPADGVRPRAGTGAGNAKHPRPSLIPRPRPQATGNAGQ